MHWESFILTDEPPAKRADALRKYQIDETEYEIYKQDETRILDFSIANSRD